MAKKEIRMITASEDVASIIDQGSEIDTELKNLSYKDKGFKKKISESATPLMNEDELSVRLEGNTAKAVVTASKKYSFAADAEKAPAVIDAFDKGLLSGVLKKSQSVNIPAEKLQEAVSVLQAAGIQATLSTAYSVDGAAYREFSDEGSPEVAAAKTALDSCVDESTTFRVKYER
jgi:hypothetical protein